MHNIYLHVHEPQSFAREEVVVSLFFLIFPRITLNLVGITYQLLILCIKYNKFEVLDFSRFLLWFFFKYCKYRKCDIIEEVQNVKLIELILFLFL